MLHIRVCYGLGEGEGYANHDKWPRVMSLESVLAVAEGEGLKRKKNELGVWSLK